MDKHLIDASLTDMIALLSELVVFSQYDFGEFLKKLIKIILQIIPADSCLIYFYDSHNKQLILVGSKKPHVHDLEQITMKETEGITGWVATHQQTVAIEDKAYLDGRFKPFKQLPQDSYESFLSVPISNNTGVVGVINIQNKNPYQFSKSQIKTVEALVKIISSAFAKIALERKVSTLQEQLEERIIVEKAKGILMKARNLTEEEAFRFMRKESMNKRKSLKEIAEAVLLVWQ